MKEKKKAREERNKEKLTHGDWIMAEFYAHRQPEVVQIDIDQERALAELYTIENTPTYILMRKGEQLWRQSGELSLERLERAVKEFKP